MSDEKFECERCGKSFDSERGLHVHESQSHNEEEEMNKDGEEPTVALTVWQFGTLMFALGLTTGIIAGGFAVGAGMTGLTSQSMNLEAGDQVDSPGTTNNQNNEDTGNTDTGGTGSVVSLQNTEYPYGDLEAGVGNGERTAGNVTFDLEGEPYIGSQGAEVTAVSFEDFECPFCKSYNENAYPQIVENYVQKGEVQYFYKNLPLPQLHPWAEPAALASECALNQDSETFWTFKQGFFDNQEALGNAHRSGNFDESMYKWAEQTGLDTEQFKQCYNNEEEMDEVQNDKSQAQTIGAKATPTIFINDQMIEGAQPYSRFESTIEEALQ
jgi:protein-disulfide isomerase